MQQQNQQQQNTKRFRKYFLYTNSWAWKRQKISPDWGSTELAQRKVEPLWITFHIRYFLFFWQSDIWHGSVYEEKGHHWISPCRINCIHWHSLILAEYLWRSNSGWLHNEAMCGVFQQWLKQQWVTLIGVDFYDHSMQTLVHHWQKFIGNGGDSVEK